jgi:hypothetical protein
MGAIDVVVETDARWAPHVWVEWKSWELIYSSKASRSNGYPRLLQRISTVHLIL